MVNAVTPPLRFLVGVAFFFLATVGASSYFFASKQKIFTTKIKHKWSKEKEKRTGQMKFWNEKDKNTMNTIQTNCFLKNDAKKEKVEKEQQKARGGEDALKKK